jgi:hypothetical protein
MTFAFSLGECSAEEMWSSVQASWARVTRNLPIIWFVCPGAAFPVHLWKATRQSFQYQVIPNSINGNNAVKRSHNLTEGGTRPQKWPY